MNTNDKATARPWLSIPGIIDVLEHNVRCALSDTQNERIRDILNEDVARIREHHAALNAVADAAAMLLKAYRDGDMTSDYLAEADDALATLARVRESGVAK